LTAVIEAMEDRDVATCNMPDAFVQTDVKMIDKDSNQTKMKIRGVLVDILCEMDKSYVEYVTLKGTQTVLNMHIIIKAIYGLLVSAMLFYKSLFATLPSTGFK